jgi:hypothetical protein
MIRVRAVDAWIAMLLVAAQPLSQRQGILKRVLACSAMPVIQQTPGQIGVHSTTVPTPMPTTIAVVTIPVIIEWVRLRALTVIVTIAHHLFRIRIRHNTRLSVRVVTPGISDRRVITLAEGTVL